jgi:hypothetical protein
VKKLIALLAVALAVFVAVYRQRIYVWDPVASVTRDGVPQDGVRVMLNFSNDVLVDDQSTNKRTIYVVQHGNKTAEFATDLRCIQYLACMTDADQATGDQLTPGERGGREAFEGVTMTNRRVEFVNEHGDLIAAVLR